MILIDELTYHSVPNKPYLNGYWCHMGTDDLTDQGLIELHAMAELIGLRRYFQNKRFFPHYDLKAPKRALVLQIARENDQIKVEEVDSYEYVRRTKRNI